MVTFVLILGVVNIGLGFTLAVLHDRIYSPARHAEPELRPQSNPTLLAPLAQTDFTRSVPKPGELPDHWRALLEAFSLHDVGRVESTLWVCVRQCEEARQQLTRADYLQRLSQQDEIFSKPEFENVVRTCRRWCDDLREAVRQIAANTSDPPYSEGIEDLLGDFAAQVDADLTDLEQDDIASSRHAGRRRELMNRLLDLAYRLRDELYDRLATELQARGRMAELATHLRVDSEMAVYNRIGLESLLASYRQADPATRATTSIALIDVDRFRRVQQELGAAQADAFLNVFSLTAERSLRKNRGFDRTARIGGHTFIVFLGGTPLPGAEMVCERLRQQIEAASFLIGHRELEITVSCSAIEFSAEDSTQQTLQRLRTALAEAHKAGRNRTCVDDGQQLVVVQPKQQQIVGQRIEVPAPEIM